MTTPRPDGQQASEAGNPTGLLRETGSRASNRRAETAQGPESTGVKSLNGSTRSTPPPPHTSSSLSQQPRATHSSGAAATAAGTATAPHPAPGDRVRAHNPAKRVQANPALDDLRSAVTRDALREKAREEASNGQPSVQRNLSEPLLAAAANVSPPASPTMNSSSKPSTATRAEPRTIMPRNPSIDSTVSSLSSASTSHKANGTSAYRVSQESAEPQDVASLIAAAGSPEAAILKLINEKNQAASHNAQLWRLVEKQRAMILGINKDLEKSLKEKERYRRKLKDHLAQSESAPALISANQQLEDLVTREDSVSPAVPENGTTAAVPVSIRDISMDSRKVSDTSDLASSGVGRSDTPQDASNAPSSVLPATPQSANSAQAAVRELERPENVPAPTTSLDRKVPAPISVDRIAAQTPPLSPRLQELQGGQQQPIGSHLGHQKTYSNSSAISPPASAASFSSPKNQASRKAPPAPLNLYSPKKVEPSDVTNNIIDPSDSEYEEDPDSARAEKMTRGRRKTREEDDREREAIAMQEEEYRSLSKKSKKSKSKSKPPVEETELPPDMSRAAAVEPMATDLLPEQRARMATYQQSNDPAAILKQRAVAEASGPLQKSNTAPSLMSPGLPMSPRPGDRPMNSPMPRAPNKMLNSMPMSPKSGMAGLPLSPRAPRQPIPMPPQTPLAFASPHLARAEGYQQPAPQPSSLANLVRSSPDDTPEQERPSTSSEHPVPMTPGEIYKGLVTEQYPDLLLPPNALPSIYVKTASSRMRPSRMSYIAPKNSDENPVFTLAVHERSGNMQLWRVEKTFAALAQLDEHIKSVWNMREKLPDKALFAGHAPAKIDARRVALDTYFNRMLESVTEEKVAKVVCKFLSTDAIGAAESEDYFGGAGSVTDARPDTPVKNLRPRREGYLTKRGKNFGGWKARYFILDGPIFKYFDNKGGAQLGSIKLQNAQIGKQSNHGQNALEDEDNQFRHAFLILEPKKKDSSALVRHVLCAESDEERDIWVDALLQYVDYRDDEDDIGAKAAQALKQDIGGARSPRFQRSFNDLRPPSRSSERTESKPESLRAVGYNDTVAGEAPVLGPGPPGARKVETPSPPHDGNFGPTVEPQGSNHPSISGPTNLQVISNSSDWGMRPPPTPSYAKDKKRSIFSGFRGRSSSDLAPGEKVMSPGLPPQDHYATGTPRAVFGVPLAEAVEFARPADVATELPAVVYRCIEYLLAKNAVGEEGIFRLSGSNTVIKGLKDRFNTEGDVNLTADDKYYDIHAVASLLKLYLRELPSSILTRELHLEFLQCLEMHGKEKVVALNVLVNKLPRANLALLAALSSFLLSIVNNSEVNKMNVRNGKFSCVIDKPTSND